MADLPPKKIHRVDWARVQRDYATGRFTDMELAAKYSTAREVVNRRRRADRAKDPASWPIDLRADVKRATAALLMRDQVTRTITGGTEAETVLAAAHAVKDIILQHRAEARRGREVVSALMTELASVTLHRASLDMLVKRASATLSEAEATALASQVQELAKLSTRIGGVQKLADAMARMQTLERKAFGIGDDDTGSNPLDTMNEAELQAEVDRLTQALGGAAG